jgi:two-component system sensor histidine kinase ChvG
MLKDEVALSTEKMNKIDLISIVQSVVDDFNNIYIEKRGIKIELIANNSKKDFKILGIENRIEQILANLLDNAISFSKDKQKIIVEVEKNQNDQVILRVIDQGQGFKEKKLTKIFDRFYSNRPDKFGEHSGLGLNIVKNLVELHNGIIDASNNTDQGGARIEIAFPKV